MQIWVSKRFSLRNQIHFQWQGETMKTKLNRFRINIDSREMDYKEKRQPRFKLKFVREAVEQFACK